MYLRVFFGVRCADQPFDGFVLDGVLVERSAFVSRLGRDDLEDAFESLADCGRGAPEPEVVNYVSHFVSVYKPLLIDVLKAQESVMFQVSS